MEISPKSEKFKQILGSKFQSMIAGVKNLTKLLLYHSAILIVSLFLKLHYQTAKSKIFRFSLV